MPYVFGFKDNVLTNGEWQEKWLGASASKYDILSTPPIILSAHSSASPVSSAKTDPGIIYVW